MTTLREALVGARVACRKHRFDTRADAERVRDSYVGSRRDRDPARPFNVWRCPRCNGWHLGHGRLRDVSRDELAAFFGEEADVTTDLGQLRAAVAATEGAVVVVGGKSGMYARWVHAHPRVVHVESTETGGRLDSEWRVPTHAGLLVLSKFASAQLLRRARQQAKAASLPTFGIFNSPGAVNRALGAALGVEPGEEEEAAVAMTTSVHEPAAPAEPPRPPAADDAEEAVLRVFDEAQAALDLARETALRQLRAAREASEDAAKLRALRDALRVAGVVS